MKSPFLYKIIICFLLFLSVSSCRKELPDIEQPNSYLGGNFSEVFEAYWNGMNSNYVFWDIDPTDWDAVYKKYKPLFSGLSLNKPADVQTAFTYFKEISAQLVDSHYNLQFSDKYLPGGIINPAADRHRAQPDYHDRINPNFFYNTIPARYIGTTNTRKAVINSGTKDQFFVISGKINNNILYLYFSSFDLQKYATNATIKPVLDYFFDQLKNNLDLKGLILDVRNNSGGSTDDLNFLVGALTDQIYTFGSSRGKSDNGRLDYSGWSDLRVTPAKDAKAFTAPVIILADQNSASMSEITTLAIQELPHGNGKFIGEKTWGAQGPRTLNLITNSGPFQTSFFKEVTMAAMVTRDKKGKVYEGIGFSPDVEVKFNAAAIAAGNDPQLEKAINLIP